MNLPESQSKARILIVDDHPIVRKGLVQLINRQPDLTVCAEAGGTNDALQAIEETQPDVAIIDLFLADGSGLDLLKQVKAQHSSLRMLVASAQDEFLFVERALHAGALGYVSKTEPPNKLVEAVRCVLQGRVYLSPEMMQRTIGRALNPEQFMHQSPIDRFSDRELEVFELIGSGLTTHDIANRLNLSSKTVQTYRENLKAKLNLRNSTELVRYAVEWTLENRQPQESTKATT